VHDLFGNLVETDLLCDTLATLEVLGGGLVVEYFVDLV